MNAAARDVSDTRKFDHCLTQLLHDDLHWLDVADRVTYKLGVIMRRCRQGKPSVRRPKGEGLSRHRPPQNPPLLLLGPPCRQAFSSHWPTANSWTAVMTRVTSNDYSAHHYLRKSSTRRKMTTAGRRRVETTYSITPNRVRMR